MSSRPVIAFPILNDPYLKAIPWPMIAPFETQAQANHYQSLSRLAQRGGLSVCEACAVMERRPWAKMDADIARVRLVDAIQRKIWEPAP